MSLLSRLIFPEDSERNALTGNRILGELTECLKKSCDFESVGNSMLFNMHYMIILHPDVYKARNAAFPAIVMEAVMAFYRELKKRRSKYKAITPISADWIFKFGPGTQFAGETIGPNDLRVIGMLTGLREDQRPGGGVLNGTTKVTMKTNVTNVFNKMDINEEAFRGITFTDGGSYMTRFNPDLEYGAASSPSSAASTPAARPTASKSGALAEIRYHIADTNAEGSYGMKDKEIVIARKEPENLRYTNYLLIDSGFVSNPHARIRYNEAIGRFQIASFSRNETRVNEQLVPQSSPDNPQWFDLKDQSQLLLNCMVTVRFAKQS